MEIRIRLRIFLLVTALAVGGFVVVAPAHLAQAGSTLDSFVGQWAGRGITSNVDAVPRVTARDLDLVIEKRDNGGFTISSTFVQLSQVEQIPRSRTLIFEPSGISDLWQAQEGCLRSSSRPAASPCRERYRQRWQGWRSRERSIGGRSPERPQAWPRPGPP